MVKEFKTEEEALEYCFENLIRPSLMKEMVGNEEGKLYNLFSNYRNRYYSNKEDKNKRGLGIKARKRIFDAFNFKIETIYKLSVEN